MLDLGCNAVLAYQQDFDVEGDSGIVARAYGTACVIQRRETDKANPLSRQVCACLLGLVVICLHVVLLPLLLLVLA